MKQGNWKFGKYPVWKINSMENKQKLPRISCMENKFNGKQNRNCPEF
jgi:hypothetical protein